MAGLGRRTHYRKHLTDSVLYDLPEPKLNERIAKVCSTRGSNQFDLLLSRDIDSSQPPEVVLAILPTKFRKLIWLKRNDFVIVQTVTDIIASIQIDSNDHNDEVINERMKQTATQGNDEVDDINLANKSSNAIQCSSEDEGMNEEMISIKNEKLNDSSSGIRFMINSILYKDQIKHLVSKGKWPTHPDFQWPRGDKYVNDATIEANTMNQDHPYSNNSAQSISANGSNHHDNHSPEELDDGTDGDYLDENFDDSNFDDPLLFVNTNRLRYVTVQDSDSSADDD